MDQTMCSVRTKSVAPAILVLSENHYPGWKAYVDNRPVETLRVDYNLRGVVLTAGEHDDRVSLPTEIGVVRFRRFAIQPYWPGALVEARICECADS